MRGGRKGTVQTHTQTDRQTRGRESIAVDGGDTRAVHQPMPRPTSPRVQTSENLCVRLSSYYRRARDNRRLRPSGVITAGPTSDIKGPGMMRDVLVASLLGREALTVEDVDVDRGRFCVVGPADVLSRVGRPGVLNEERAAGLDALFRDHAHPAAVRVVANHLRQQ